MSNADEKVKKLDLLYPVMAAASAVEETAASPPPWLPYSGGRAGKPCLYKASSQGEQGMGKEGWPLICFSVDFFVVVLSVLSLCFCP